MEPNIIEKMHSLYDSGLVEELYELIKPYIEKRDPYALYLSSRFSFPSESYDDSEKRRLKYLIEASENDIPEAMYQLFSLYMSGDGVERNPQIGIAYLKKAVSADYPVAKFTYGVCLFDGAMGLEKNEVEGLKLIEEAASQGVDGALEALKSKGQRP